jgi:hypothetical protein
MNEKIVDGFALCDVELQQAVSASLDGATLVPALHEKGATLSALFVRSGENRNLSAQRYLQIFGHSELTPFAVVAARYYPKRCGYR